MEQNLKNRMAAQQYVEPAESNAIANALPADNAEDNALHSEQDSLENFNKRLNGFLADSLIFMTSCRRICF